MCIVTNDVSLTFCRHERFGQQADAYVIHTSPDTGAGERIPFQQISYAEEKNRNRACVKSD